MVWHRSYKSLIQGWDCEIWYEKTDETWVDRKRWENSATDKALTLDQEHSTVGIAFTVTPIKLGYYYILVWKLFDWISPLKVASCCRFSVETPDNAFDDGVTLFITGST